MANRSHSPDPEVTALLHEHSCISKDDIPATSTQRELAIRYSPDSATALLLYCLLSIPEIRDTQTLFQQQLQSVSKTEQSEYLADRAQHYTVLFVPGWGYLSNGEVTGSNLRAPREIIESLGYETELVTLQDFGSVEENARLLITQLEQKLRQGKQVILASASSGGPTVALALADQDIATHPRLAGWINICGVVRGSPIIDRFGRLPASLRPRTIALFEGWTYRDLRSMSQQSSEPRFAAFTPPSGMNFTPRCAKGAAMLFRYGSPPEGSQGKNLSDRHPSSIARSTSEGVQTPGANGKPAVCAALTTRGFKPGETPNVPPAATVSLT